MAGDLLLVGSIPLDTPEQVSRTVVVTGEQGQGERQPDRHWQSGLTNGAETILQLTAIIKLKVRRSSHRRHLSIIWSMCNGRMRWADTVSRSGCCSPSGSRR
jgi:hypothetical protein